MQLPPSSIIPFVVGCLLSACGTYTPQSAEFLPEGAGEESEMRQRLPDPRFRPPFGVWEIDRVASMVARATGREAAGRIVVSEESPLASIRGPLEGGEILINPRAAASIPPNSWAFIIGHEFAHQTHGLGRHGRTSPEEESEADVIGARYATTAGFDLAAHIAWTLSHQRDGWSHSHGSIHDRANRLGARLGVPREAVWTNLRRYGFN